MRRLPVLILGAAALSLAAAQARPGPPRLPAIVFVSRGPAPSPGVIPGLGPAGRTLVTRGRLLIREPDGRIRDLLPPGAMLDASDPAVSPDARRIAFAGVERAGEPWRIWMVGVDGHDLRALTSPGARAVGGPRAWRADDFDPCWLTDRSVLFASTRWPQTAQYADVPATNLFTISEGAPERGGPLGVDDGPFRLTCERNGAEEPCFDPATGHVIFARWWFNRWLPGRDGPTLEPGRSVARESVNVWHAMETSLGADGAHLAAGDFRARLGSMAYQPTVMPDGSIVAVFAANLGLTPRAGSVGIHRLPRAGGAAERVAGALIDPGSGSYEDARGLAAPAACAPAALPDGRLLFSWSPGGRGDFGLYVTRPGDDAPPVRVVDLRGTLELDGAPIVPRPPGPGADPWFEWYSMVPPRAIPRAAPSRWESREALAAAFADSLRWGNDVTWFRSADVFGGAPADSALPGPPPRTAGARIRFYAPLARAGAPGSEDLALLHEASVAPDGSVRVSIPADLPMFEELVDAQGNVLMGTRGPAHVAGTNATLEGRGTGCIGCHAGHSMRLGDGTPHFPGRDPRLMVR